MRHPAPARLALACLLAWPAVCAAAQDLAQLYQEARDHSPALRAAAADRDAARPRAAAAAAQLGYSVTATASGNASRSSPSNAAGDLVAPDTGIDTSAGINTSINTARSLNAALTVKKPLIDVAVESEARKARLGIEVADIEHDTAEQDFALRLAESYVAALSAQDLLASTRSNGRAIDAHLESARQRLQAGTGIVTDVQEALARHELAQAQIVAAQGQLRTAALALSRLVGRSDVVPAPLALPFAAPPPPPPLEWREAATKHPSRRRMRLLADIAALETERVRGEGRATLSAVASASMSRAASMGTVRVYSLGVELSMPLFDSGVTRSRVDEAQLLEQRARSDLEEAESSIAETLERTHTELLSAYAQLPAQEAALSSARAALAGHEVAHRAGVRLQLEVLDAQARAFQAERDLSKSRYDLLLAQLRYWRAGGILTYEHLQEFGPLWQR